MKTIKILLTALVLTVSTTVFAQEKTDKIKVYGNCGMCKNRIQKALKTDGISSADWNKETKMLTVTYDPAKISNEAIQKKVAAAGHDTEKFKADDATYDKLPGCCHYDRKGEKGKKKDSGHHAGHNH